MRYLTVAGDGGARDFGAVERLVQDLAVVLPE